MLFLAALVLSLGGTGPPKQDLDAKRYFWSKGTPLLNDKKLLSLQFF